MLTAAQRDAWIIANLKRLHPGVTEFSHDIGDPTRPVGHASGIATSTRVLRSYRNTHRPASQYVEPKEVIDCLTGAGVKRWVLMGLYGYVGYLPRPRSTQDVDILVDARESKKATRAISERWPTLQVDAQSVVIRFRDPGEVGIDGEIKQVIDLMLPSDEVYKEILRNEVRIDEQTGHRIPSLEAAVVAKYSAMVSPYRHRSRKRQDATDFANIVGPNIDRLDQVRLHQLAELIFPGGGDDVLDFVRRTVDDEPFAI